MNKKLNIVTALMAAVLTASAAPVNISTGNTTLLLDATEGQTPKIIYYGARLTDKDAMAVTRTATPTEAYPVYGMVTQTETALSLRHGDGNRTLELGITGTDTKRDSGTQTVSIKMKDNQYPLYVTLNYKTYDDSDVIETWTEIINKEKKAVQLNRFMSAHLPIRRGDVWLSHLYGSWANEGQLAREPLQAGVKTIKNKDGVRNSHTAHAEVMFSLDGKPEELYGRVIGAALCYSGNYKLSIDTDDGEYHHLFAGINEDDSSYTLASGECFTTPPLAVTYSEDGCSGVSRNYHKWCRKYKLMHGDTARKIILNSWEGVYFNVNEESMKDMIDEISGMGGELFVMDDGWFGGKYQRNSDNAALGDWNVDTRKLPSGIKPLIEHAKEKGVGFGLWIEPEMTNTVSELYEKHPEWVIKASGREPVTGRGGTQLVLDLSNPKVQEYVFGVFDKIMKENPGIEYIKWDANMGIQSHGSSYLTADRQSHLYIDWHRGFEKVCSKIREKYPDVVIQACASGGGRANFGVLPWFDEIWVSDNTDALQRVYMQWGTSYFFPPMVMGSHISATPNHQTFRTIPMKYRIDVAMSGRLGMEIQPKNMSEEEKAQCAKAIAEYKEVRDVVQKGGIYRLASPYDGQGVASLMYVADDRSDAVFYWYKTEHFCNQHLPRVRMAGLDPDKQYRVTEMNRVDNKPLAFEGETFSGAYLMANGLEIPYTHDVDYHKLNDYSSRVLRIRECSGSADTALADK